MNKIIDLTNIYENIHNCNICPRMDNFKALRRTDAIDFSSDVFIVSQALAENQLRLSGVNFFNKEGNPGPTGLFLEKFLNKFSRTIYPQNEIHIENDKSIPARDAKYLSVYNTEIAQCFPGKASQKGDRVPVSTEIFNCFDQKFLIQELTLLKPKIILLMGVKSMKSFYKFILKEKCIMNLRDHITEIEISKEIPNKNIDGFTVKVLPIMHASPANPRFKEFSNNINLINLIKEVLA